MQVRSTRNVGFGGDAVGRVNSDDAVRSQDAVFFPVDIFKVFGGDY